MKQKENINALPSKRIYLSIIADYHLNTALCELIDNAIDNWTLQGKKGNLKILINLDYERQIIEIVDNSGGVKEEEIHLIVSPGQSKNTADDVTIGIFGVGSKRAVVALAEEIRIFTRYKRGPTFLVQIDDGWIKNDSTWDLPKYEVDNINENTTKIELLKLRDPIFKENEKELLDHLGATYALFLTNANIEIKVNATSAVPLTFDNWSFPPGYEPKNFNGTISFEEKTPVNVEILGGLTKSGEPSGGEYGLYLYCNDRLIARAYKGPEIGFRQMRIGEPHPAASLARVIVKLKGASQLMPWNSSKSEINPRHPSYREIQDHIDKVLTHYATLSKRWSTGGGWEENVFQYKKGKVDSENLESISSSTKLHLPPIPRTPSHKYADVLKTNNRELANRKPWVKGFYEASIAVEELPKLKLEQNNRLSLLILDSMLEIAFKEYLVNDSGTSYSDGQLIGIFASRPKVQSEVQKTITISSDYWKKINHFYRIRCELVHKRASVNISDDDLKIFRRTYEYVIRKMFRVNFRSN